MLRTQAGVEGAASGWYLTFHAVANSGENTCGTLFQLQICQVSNSSSPILPQFPCLKRTAVVLGSLAPYLEMQPRKSVRRRSQECYVAVPLLLLLILFPFACSHSRSFPSSPTLTQGSPGERCQQPHCALPAPSSLCRGLRDKTVRVLHSVGECFGRNRVGCSRNGKGLGGDAAGDAPRRDAPGERSREGGCSVGRGGGLRQAQAVLGCGGGGRKACREVLVAAPPREEWGRVGATGDSDTCPSRDRVCLASRAEMGGRGSCARRTGKPSAAHPAPRLRSPGRGPLCLGDGFKHRAN